jgi:hypothetical protein
MAIVLNEDTAATDQLNEALFALVEAAMASEVAYTPEALKEMVDFQIEALNEAGGLISWIKRHYTGVDHNVPGQFKREIEAGIKSESQRRTMIASVDAMIAKAERALHGGSGGDFAKGLIPAWVLLGPVAGIAGGVTRAAMTGGNRQSGQIEKYIKALKDVKAEIKAAEIED